MTTPPEPANSGYNPGLPQPEMWAGLFTGGPTGTSLPDGERLLDVVDAVLQWSGRRVHRQEWQAVTGELDRILRTGRSVWRVNTARTGLEQRVDETVTAAVSHTTRAAGHEAAGHLTTAWTAAYGRNPDPDKAFSEAAKAVEAVACALVLPANGNATLGTVRTHLRDAPTKWELVLPARDGNPGSATPVVEMLTALWEGQRSQHAGTASSRRQPSTSPPPWSSGSMPACCAAAPRDSHRPG